MTATVESFGQALRAANDQLAELAKEQREPRAAVVAALEAKTAELDDVMVAFEGLGKQVAGITVLMNRFHTERDDAREDATILRGKLAAAEAELAALRGGA